MAGKAFAFAFAVCLLTCGLMDAVALRIPCALAAEEGSDAKPGPAIAKVGAWMLGEKLSLSAIMYFRKGDRGVLGEAQDIAAKLGVPRPEFPADKPKQGDPGLTKVLDYFGKGGGANVATDLRRVYAEEHGSLYEIAVRLIMVWDLYRFDPAFADPMAKSLRTKAILIALPDQLWRPTLSLVEKRAKYEDVKAAVLKADEDTLSYLREKARAEQR